MAAQPRGVETLRYPFKAIKDFDDYLKIDIVKYQAPGIEAVPGTATFNTSTELLSSKTIVPESVIILPIPQNIQDSNSVDWGDSSLNALEAKGVEVLGKGMESSNIAGGIGQGISNITQFFKDVSVGGNLQDQVTSYFSSQIVNGLGGNVDAASLLSRATGQVLNPNMELLFKGVSLREFSFDFDFAPRDGIEGQQVKKIIRTLKKAMAPRTTAGSSQGAGLFISAPNVFRLQYMSGGKPHPFLNKFKPMAMKGMSVNYTGSGTYSVYGDSTPVHMRLTVNFQELNPIYYEDYKDSDVGVGY